MLVANFPPDTIEVGKGIRPLVSSRVVIIHDESHQVAYQPNGVHSVRAKVKAGNGNTRYDIGFCQVFKDQFETLITHQSTAGQTFTVYFPFDMNLVFQMDEDHRRFPGDSLFIELDWHLMASQVITNQAQQLITLRVMSKPNPSEAPTNPILRIDPPKWSEILRAFGWPDRRLIEIRFSKVGAGKWPDAAKEVQAAEEAYEGRNDPSTLMACERAFEAILGTDAVRAQPQALETAFADLLVNSITNTQKRDTVAKMLTQTVLYVRRMKHVQPTTPTHPLFDVDSGDAELGLIVSKAALSYLSKL